METQQDQNHLIKLLILIHVQYVQQQVRFLTIISSYKLSISQLYCEKLQLVMYVCIIGCPNLLVKQATSQLLYDSTFFDFRFNKFMFQLILKTHVSQMLQYICNYNHYSQCNNSYNVEQYYKHKHILRLEVTHTIASFVSTKVQCLTATLMCLFNIKWTSELLKRSL